MTTTMEGSMSHDREDARVHEQGNTATRSERLSRRRLLRRAALAGAGIALAPLLAACGGEGDEEDGEEQEQEEEEEQGEGNDV